MIDATKKPDGRCIHCRTNVNGIRVNHPSIPGKKITVYDCPNCGRIGRNDVEMYLYPSTATAPE